MAKRKSKARQEYDRLRKNLRAGIRRAEKSGSDIWIDLPLSPLQQGLKGTAKEYQKAITQLKKADKLFRSAVAAEKAEAKARAKAQRDLADTVINNFVDPLQVGAGGKMIKWAIERFKKSAGSIQTAQMLQNMADNNQLVGKAEIYNESYAYNYISQMGQEMTRLEMLSAMEWDQIDDALQEDYMSDYPNELQ